MAKTVHKATADKETIKAKAREQVANRKLDRLKDRYEKLKAITDSQLETQTHQHQRLESELREARAQNEELAAQLKFVKDEAAMWKSQLFDQLDRAERKHQDFVNLQTELAEAQWQMVELLNEERARCETERAKAEVEAEQARRELVAARARVDGLKNLGACLAAKLERATAQRNVLQREHARLVEATEERIAQLEARDLEIEELRIQLFDARRLLLSRHLETQSWETLKQGLARPDEPEPTESAEPEAAGRVADIVLSPQKAIGHRRLKLAALPEQSSQIPPAPHLLLRRAGKALGDWLKLGD
jgi:hypothetical protein